MPWPLPTKHAVAQMPWTMDAKANRTLALQGSTRNHVQCPQPLDSRCCYVWSHMVTLCRVDKPSGKGQQAPKLPQRVLDRPGDLQLDVSRSATSSICILANGHGSKSPPLRHLQRDSVLSRAQCVHVWFYAGKECSGTGQNVPVQPSASQTTPMLSHDVLFMKTRHCVKNNVRCKR